MSGWAITLSPSAGASFAVLLTWDFYWPDQVMYLMVGATIGFAISCLLLCVASTVFGLEHKR